MELHSIPTNRGLLNSSNWNYSYFQSRDMKVFISFGADPSGENDGGGEPTFRYFLTMTDLEGTKEIFQLSFDNLELAISQMNSRYSEWKFVDPLNKTSEGCESCSNK